MPSKSKDKKWLFDAKAVSKVVWIAAVIIIIIIAAVGVYWFTLRPAAPKNTIKILVYGDYMFPPVQEWAPEWEALHPDWKIELHGLPFPQIVDIELLELSSGTSPYDIVALLHPKVIDAYPYVKNLTQYIVNDPAWKWNELVPAVRKQFYYGNDIYAVPVDGVPMVFIYRTDLLNDPAEIAAFESTYGFQYNITNLTWDEYLKVAEFFTRPGENLHGCSLLGPKGVVWQDFLTIYYSFGGRWFDPETMEPRINSPPALEALRIMKEMNNYALLPLEAIEPDVWEGFAKGQLATAIQFPDIVKWAQNPEISTVRGKLASSLPPGSDKVWDYITGVWLSPDAPNAPPLPGRKINGIHQTVHSDVTWGWYIPKTVPDEKVPMLLDWIQFFSVDPDRSTWTVKHGYGYDPYRLPHYEPERWVPDVFDTNDQAENYLGGDWACGTYGWYAPRVPGMTEMIRILGTYIAKAMAGETTPEGALAAIEAAFRAIIDSIGRDVARDAYLKTAIPEEIY